MRLPLLTTVLGLAGALNATAATPARSLYFEHHDWVVACDNTLTCRAAGYATDDTSTLSVLLTRKGGPGQAIEGRLSLRPEEGLTQPRARCTCASSSRIWARWHRPGAKVCTP